MTIAHTDTDQPDRAPRDDDQQMRDWLIEKVQPLERAYLARDDPWRQSGFSGPEERWNACRRPVADCIDRDGTLLDIGCANGYLLECIVAWKRAQGIAVEPFGLDFGGKLAALARRRLPAFAGNVYVGDAWAWRPSRMFDFVRTELCYVPPPLRKRFVARLLAEVVAPGGRLLVAEYRSRIQPYHTPWVDAALRRYGFTVSLIRSGRWEGKELTRVAVVRKADA